MYLCASYVCPRTVALQPGPAPLPVPVPAPEAQAQAQACTRSARALPGPTSDRGERGWSEGRGREGPIAGSAPRCSEQLCGWGRRRADRTGDYLASDALCVCLTASHVGWRVYACSERAGRGCRCTAASRSGRGCAVSPLATGLHAPVCTLLPCYFYD